MEALPKFSVAAQKNWVAQNLGGAAAPLAPPARTPMGKAVEMWWCWGPGAGGGGKVKNVRRREIKAELWRSTSFTAWKC